MKIEFVIFQNEIYSREYEGFVTIYDTPNNIKILKFEPSQGISEFQIISSSNELRKFLKIIENGK